MWDIFSGTGPTKYNYNIIVSPNILKFNPSLCAKVKIQISHHTLEGTDIASSKEIVFIMDEPKGAEPKKGRKKKTTADAKPSVSIKNFGAHVQVSKLKDVATLTLCWRCRIDSAGDGTKTIMPIRPTMCLAGGVQLDDEILRLM